ncbi:MAG: hypothetical protein U9R51_04490, partial [Actinomycetota bacterium]|nr:hypothetical protein [Actinomycetota bacterium]
MLRSLDAGKRVSLAPGATNGLATRLRISRSWIPAAGPHRPATEGCSALAGSFRRNDPVSGLI